jgi:hypothetical protein
MRRHPSSVVAGKEQGEAKRRKLMKTKEGSVKLSSSISSAWKEERGVDSVDLSHSTRSGISDLHLQDLKQAESSGPWMQVTPLMSLRDIRYGGRTLRVYRSVDPFPNESEGSSSFCGLMIVSPIKEDLPLSRLQNPTPQAERGRMPWIHSVGRDLSWMAHPGQLLPKTKDHLLSKLVPLPYKG